MEGHVIRKIVFCSNDYLNVSFCSDDGRFQIIGFDTFGNHIDVVVSKYEILTKEYINVPDNIEKLSSDGYLFMGLPSNATFFVKAN